MRKITKELANNELKTMFEMFGIKYEENGFYDFVEADEDVVTIYNNPKFVGVDEEKGLMFYKITFDCGIKGGGCRRYTTNEMQELAKRMQLISYTVYRLNETFKDTIICEKMIKD